jgi:3-hydroxyacyl-CoA dehydrogenase
MHFAESVSIMKLVEIIPGMAERDTVIKKLLLFG